MAEPNLENRPRILVVDDEEMNRDLLARVLDRYYDVDTVENGKKALALLQNTSYDVILLDMMMPVMNGTETLMHIRANADLAELPVIIVSAVSETRNVADAIQMGANDYITKPIDIPIVKARVETQVLLKRMMDERREAIGALQMANLMKAQMMQVASHDLKNPVNNVKMALALLKDVLPEQEELDSLMQVANEGIESMIEIIHDFLSSNAVDNNGISVVISETEAAPIVAQVVEQYSLAARVKDISVDMMLENAMILADSRRLQQVFGNLLSNALKYSPREGMVWVRSLVKGDVWRLEVQDSGAGIPENERRHLFSPFSKNLISTEPTDGESSTGLGLWIAAEMVRLQGGKIGMDSPAEGGCCFWFELPLVNEFSMNREQ